jgi:hypothetical protein
VVRPLRTDTYKPEICDKGHQARIRLHGPYSNWSPAHQKYRYRCMPKGGAAPHTFVAEMPARQPTHSNPKSGQKCAHCQRSYRTRYPTNAPIRLALRPLFASLRELIGAVHRLGISRGAFLISAAELPPMRGDERWRVDGADRVMSPRESGELSRWVVEQVRTAPATRQELAAATGLSVLTIGAIRMRRSRPDLRSAREITRHFDRVAPSPKTAYFARLVARGTCEQQTAADRSLPSDPDSSLTGGCRCTASLAWSGPFVQGI